MYEEYEVASTARMKLGRIYRCEFEVASTANEQQSSPSLSCLVP